MNIPGLAAASAAVILAAGGASASGNLLVNGGFETNNGYYNTGFAGWTVTYPSLSVACSGDTQACGQGESSVASGAEAGFWYLADGTVTEDNQISQTFADTAGQDYEVSGWAASDGPTYGGVTGPAHYSLDIDGTVFAYGDVAGPQGWTEYSWTFTGTGSDTLTITTRNAENYNYFDNFAVVATSVPEPAAWTLMIAGLGFSGARLRRRRGGGVAV